MRVAVENGREAGEREENDRESGEACRSIPLGIAESMLEVVGGEANVDRFGAGA